MKIQRSISPCCAPTPDTEWYIIGCWLWKQRQSQRHPGLEWRIVKWREVGACKTLFPPLFSLRSDLGLHVCSDFFAQYPCIFWEIWQQRSLIKQTDTSYILLPLPLLPPSQERRSLAGEDFIIRACRDLFLLWCVLRLPLCASADDDPGCTPPRRWPHHRSHSAGKGGQRGGGLVGSRWTWRWRWAPFSRHLCSSDICLQSQDAKTRSQRARYLWGRPNVCMCIHVLPSWISYFT